MLEAVGPIKTQQVNLKSFHVLVSSKSSFFSPLSHSDWSSDATSVKRRSQSHRLSSYEKNKI